MKNSLPLRYGQVAQFFHWSTAVLVLAAFTLGPGGSEQRVYSPAQDFERQIHETLGLCVLGLLVLRLLWRLLDTRPVAIQLPPWMNILAKAVQVALYLLLFAVPASAIVGAWLEGHPLTLLAGIQIVPPVGLSHDLGATIASVHTWLGDTILWLAGFHAVAALYHHFLLKDSVLVSMLPRWVPFLKQE